MTSPDLLRRFALVLVDVGDIVKDQTADTGSYTYQYAHIDSVLRLVEPVCAEHNFQLTQPVRLEGDACAVDVTLICTETGDTLTFPGGGFRLLNDPQATGGALTYWRRYGLVSVFRIKEAIEDDDAGQAHRAATDPERRTKAEIEVRKIVDRLRGEDRAAFQTEFRAQFGSGLTALPESKHGDALTWAKSWQAPASGDAVSGPQPAEGDDPTGTAENDRETPGEDAEAPIWPDDPGAAIALLAELELRDVSARIFRGWLVSAAEAYGVDLVGAVTLGEVRDRITNTLIGREFVDAAVSEPQPEPTEAEVFGDDVLDPDETHAPFWPTTVEAAVEAAEGWDLPVLRSACEHYGAKIDQRLGEEKLRARLVNYLLGLESEELPG